MTAIERNAKIRAKRAAAITAGKCIDCDEPAITQHCQGCRDVISEKSKQRYHARRAAGLCIACKQPSTMAQCDTCRDRINAVRGVWRGRRACHRIGIGVVDKLPCGCAGTEVDVVSIDGALHADCPSCGDRWRIPPAKLLARPWGVMEQRKARAA